MQLSILNGAGYIEVQEGFVGKRPCTTCYIISDGRKAMEEHVEVLRGYLSGL